MYRVPIYYIGSLFEPDPHGGCGCRSRRKQIDKNDSERYVKATVDRSPRALEVLNANFKIGVLTSK